MRGSCGKQCSLDELAEHFGETLETSSNPQRIAKEYVKPKARAKVIQKDDPLIKYWADRRISKETLDKAKVVSDLNGNVLFPYFYKGELVLIKYKLPREQRIDPATGKKERKAWQEADGMPVLWGIDECDPKLGPLVITEGEPDRLSLMECGIANATSVPAGSNNLDWIEICWNEINKFDTIIIWGDVDKAGKDMLDKVSIRLGIERCRYVASPYKDANEHLMNFSTDIEIAKQSVRDFLEASVQIPISGVIDFADIEDADYESMEATYSGIAELDSVLGGFKEGLVTIWSGKRCQGKSTIINHLVVAEAIEQGQTVAIYSGEVTAKMLAFGVALPMAGTSVTSVTDSIGVVQPHVDDTIRSQIKEWCRGKIFVYDNSKSHAPQDIMARFKELAQRHGTKVFIIDNLMTIRFRGQNKDDQMMAHSDFVQECANFAKKFNAHVHIVVHPRKVDGIMGIDDIRGTGDIANASDNVLLVSRGSEMKDRGEGNTNYQTFIEVAKNRIYGVTDVSIGLRFDVANRRFYRFDWQRDKTYSWDIRFNLDWLGSSE